MKTIAKTIPILDQHIESSNLFHSWNLVELHYRTNKEKKEYGEKSKEWKEKLLGEIWLPKKLFLTLSENFYNKNFHSG